MSWHISENMQIQILLTLKPFYETETRKMKYLFKYELICFLLWSAVWFFIYDILNQWTNIYKIDNKNMWISEVS